MQLIFLLEQVLNGLLVGAYYLLIALGLSRRSADDFEKAEEPAGELALVP